MFVGREKELMELRRVMNTERKLYLYMGKEE